MLTEAQKKEMQKLSEQDWGEVATAVGRGVLKLAKSKVGKRLLKTGARYGLRKLGQMKWAKKHKLGGALRGVRRAISGRPEMKLKRKAKKQ